MLSEKAIDKLIEPLVNRQEALNNYIVTLIARRIKEIGALLPSDVLKLQQLLKSGGDVRKINKEIARITGLQEKEIKNIIKTVAEDAYIDAKPYYDYRQKSYIPFEENVELQKIIKSIQKQTVDTYVNLAKAQAFMIRDLRNPNVLKPTKFAKAYYSVIDEAVQATQQGTIDYNTAMRRTIEQLADSGIRSVTYNTPTGRRYTQRLDTAVRRNILDGIRAINQGVQDEIGKQFEADGKEITVHANSAPDHEPIQGHQFTNEEYDKLQNNKSFEDYLGNKFGAVERPIGVWNCKHFTYSIILGVSKPNYTIEQLEQMKAKNAKGYTDRQGRHYTMYQCTQEQRRLETEIRKTKDRQIALKEAGDIEGAKKAQAKVVQVQRQYQAFSKACGLATKPDRIQVPDYKKII